ncbi:PAS domain S-box protein [Halorubrum sp. SD626R]|uniref:PAS domain S-box protein n=1 Tax=Halorubrum sp. SD626R TaxID=1419722 RepID=UPI0010F753A0|nr:PAS domain S-box protein [Halorubrum sp. SD626R]TKX79006.1 PAS domain S-box protein [Halorubrum sp. SD626R]
MASEDGAATDLRAFREAVESAGHSMYWTDLNGRIEYVNPAFEDQTGYPADEAVGSNANILQSGAHDDLFYERLWDTILGGDVWEGEIINERRSGERYVAAQTISPVTDESGAITRFVAVNEDITELRNYQEQLERERDRFAALLDAVPVPLVLAAFDGDDPVVKQTNDAFRETFGFSGRELGGSSLDKFIVDDETSREASEINAQVRDGDRVDREVTRQTAAGDSREFLLTATPLVWGDETDVLATYIDITDRNEARRKLERQTEELEDFANVVSHDLRSPLNVASGHLDLLAAECDSPHVDTIRNAHTRMQELIENILMLAKQGRSVDETEPVELDACASRSWETIDTGDATLAIATAKAIDADESRLRQLFGNLVRNAIEHGGDGVTVTVGDLDDGFYVADDGPGIPEDERSQVFEAGHTSTDDGTGFGLSIVQEIVDAHGWEVTVTESADGGARFEITDVSTAS